MDIILMMESNGENCRYIDKRYISCIIEVIQKEKRGGKCYGNEKYAKNSIHKNKKYGCIVSGCSRKIGTARR